VGYAAGGGNDIIVRVMQPEMQKGLGQPVVVENKPGAQGIIAAELAAKSPPDGYTLMMGPSGPMTINPATYSKLPYSPTRDFAPISMICSFPLLVTVDAKLPINSVKELIAYAKANPRKLNYGSAGNGTTTHLGGAMFASMAGVEMTHVPYKGSVPMLTDLLSGQLQLAFSSVPTALPHIKTGRLKPLAVTRLSRSATLPDLPTVHETLPGFDISLWQGIVAPAGTPRAIVMKLNQQIARSLHMPDLKSRLSAQGLDAVGNSPEQFAAYMKSEADKWAKIIKASGARPD